MWRENTFLHVERSKRKNMDQNAAGAAETNASEAEQATYQDPTTLNSSYIRDKADELLAELNAKREHDQELLEYFRVAFQEHIEDTFARIQESLMGLYARYGDEINAKIQELSEVLERLAQHENDLAEFKQMLTGFYQDVMRPEL